MSPRTSHPLSRGYAPAWASAWGQDEYGPWCAFGVGNAEQCPRWIPPGTFLMGSPSHDPERLRREEPQHQVHLSQGFWLFATPCTQALWKVVMGENPSRFQGEAHPAEMVSWDDCQMFISRLNKQVPGLSLRLPTEAQWEYACRAGTQSPRYTSDIDAIAWYSDNSEGTTHVVGQKRPNAWGLYDMLGNVWEWCHDDLRNYAEGLVIDPMGPNTAGANRALRGGGWSSPARRMSAAFRYWLHPGHSDPYVGFRCLSSEREPESGGPWLPEVVRPSEATGGAAEGRAP